MTTAPYSPVAVPAPEAFTDAVLEIITSATWPDGSPLVDVAEEVLRRELGHQLRAAAYTLAATSALMPAAVGFGAAR